MKKQLEKNLKKWNKAIKKTLKIENNDKKAMISKQAFKNKSAKKGLKKL